MATLAFNKRAHFDYELEDHFEAGLVLNGAEVKSTLSFLSLGISFSPEILPALSRCI